MAEFKPPKVRQHAQYPGKMDVGAKPWALDEVFTLPYLFRAESEQSLSGHRTVFRLQNLCHHIPTHHHQPSPTERHPPRSNLGMKDHQDRGVASKTAYTLHHHPRLPASSLIPSLERHPRPNLSTKGHRDRSVAS